MPVAEMGDPRLQAMFGASDARDAAIRLVLRPPTNGLRPLALAAASARR